MGSLFGRLALGLYNGATRARDKLWSLAVAGAFEQFGSNSVLARPCRLGGTDAIRIGSGVYLGPDCWLQTLQLPNGPRARLVIGDGVDVSGSSVLSAACEVVLEPDVLLARNVYVSDHIHGYEDAGLPIREQGVAKIAPVRISRGAWLGQNVVVCPGVSIGRGSVIGANSVVTRDIPPFVVAVGAPARVVKRFAGHKEPEPVS